MGNFAEIQTVNQTVKNGIIEAIQDLEKSRKVFEKARREVMTKKAYLQKLQVSALLEKEVTNE